jgi:hypothetical protein
MNKPFLVVLVTFAGALAACGPTEPAVTTAKPVTTATQPPGSQVGLLGPTATTPPPPATTGPPQTTTTTVPTTSTTLAVKPTTSRAPTTTRATTTTVAPTAVKGRFCSPIGATGVSSSGQRLVCQYTANDKVHGHWQ